MSLKWVISVHKRAKCARDGAEIVVDPLKTDPNWDGNPVEIRSKGQLRFSHARGGLHADERQWVFICLVQAVDCIQYLSTVVLALILDESSSLLVVHQLLSVLSVSELFDRNGFRRACFHDQRVVFVMTRPNQCIWLLLLLRVIGFSARVDSQVGWCDPSEVAVIVLLLDRILKITNDDFLHR